MAPAKPRDPHACLAPVDTSATKPATSRKRAHDEADDSSPTGDQDDTPLPPINKTPDQIRRMIHAFIENGEMKVGEFQNAINVGAGPYQRFLKQSGNKGFDNTTYGHAWAFFYRRSQQGKPWPRKRAKKASDAPAGSAAKTQKAAATVDTGDVHQDGEDSDRVEVYDSCAETRKKISAYLRKPGVTQAQFCRDLTAQYHSDKAPRSVTGAQLERFRGKKGPADGNTSAVYYAAYCFFEKLRIKEGKAKSKHREEMEKRWRHGADTERDMSRGIIARRDEHVSVNQYGQWEINGRPI